MFIEALTVCVNYADLLEITLPYWKDQFDRFVVLTAPEDEETIRLCTEMGVEYRVSERFFSEGAWFNKGAAINEGLAGLERREWVALFDCDMVIPFDLKAVLAEMPPLHQDHLHSSPRFMVKNHKDFVAWKEGRLPIHHFPYSLAVGLGYFQMFHRDADILRGKPPDQWYPEGPAADKIDFAFMRSWRSIDVIDRFLLHLGHLELNWLGRKTERFLGDLLFLGSNREALAHPRSRFVEPSGRPEKYEMLRREIRENYGNVIVFSPVDVSEDRIFEVIRHFDITFTEDEGIIVLQANDKVEELMALAAVRDLPLRQIIDGDMLKRIGFLTGGLRHQLLTPDLRLAEPIHFPDPDKIRLG